MSVNSWEDSPNFKKIINYAIFIIFVTVLAWVNSFLYFLVPDLDVRTVVFWVNILLGLILLLDVFVRWRMTKSTRQYFWVAHGWLDLIGSFPFLSLARLPNVIKTFRKLRTYGTRRIFRSFFNNRGETAALTITLAVILLFEFASIFILRAEDNVAGANIITANDALWWVLVTVATVGYGDKYPVSVHGRFIATFVIIAGVGLFGVLSGFMAKLFLGKNDEISTPEESPTEGGAVSLDDILAEIKQMRQEQADIAARLVTLEQFGQDKKRQRD